MGGVVLRISARVDGTSVFYRPKPRFLCHNAVHPSMGTIIGVTAEDSVVLAADRRVTEGGTVRSESGEKLFDYEHAGAVVTGTQGAIQEFDRELESEIRQRRMQEERPIRIQAVERIASRLAGEHGVEAIVAAHDEEAVARLRGIDSGGGVVTDEIVAYGTGASVAMGRLEAEDWDVSVEEAADRVRDVVKSVAERDTDTGEEIDVWTLEDE